MKSSADMAEIFKRMDSRAALSFFIGGKFTLILYSNEFNTSRISKFIYTCTVVCIPCVSNFENYYVRLRETAFAGPCDLQV